MANLDRGYGLRLWQPAPGTEGNIRFPRVKASTTVYPGQPLEFASGVVNPFDAATDVLRGIAIGYAAATASSVTNVLACLDPWNHLWRIQGDSGAFAATDIGKFGIITTTAADTVTKQARNVLTYATLAASPGDISDGAVFEIIDKVPEEGNVWGAYVDLIVRPVRIPPAA